MSELALFPCAHCGRAERGPWGGFNVHCDGCRARSVAMSPTAWSVIKKGAAPAPLWALVRANFTEARLEWARGEVKRWFALRFAGA